MGNRNSSLPPSDWLLVDSKFDIELIQQRQLSQLDGAINKIKGQKHKLCVVNYSTLHQAQRENDHVKGSWEYYRDITSKITRNPVFDLLKEDEYFIFAQVYRQSTKNGIIPNELRSSLLSNLSRLARDESVQFDFRDSDNGHYLYWKTLRFGVASPESTFSGNVWLDEDDNIFIGRVDLLIDDENDNEIGNKSNNENMIKMEYSSKDDMFGYTVDDKDKNTGFIHDLIDPNKHLNDSKLWIPTIFDCEYKVDPKKPFDVTKVVTSPILNLDFVKYRALYDDIAKVFKLMIQPMFESVLSYKLGKREKVIVKSMKYVLQKSGDVYHGNVHREGMGEQIVAIAIYYPQISGKDSGMKGGNLKLQVPEVCNQFLKCHEFEVEQGSCIVFSNEGYHQVPHIEYDKESKGSGPISRTILTFFLVDRHGSDHVVASDENTSVNLEFYWKYFVSYWLRVCGLKKMDSYSWMMDLIHSYLFEANHADYVYYRRHRMREEKAKPLFKPIELPHRSFYMQCEETAMEFGHNFLLT